MSMAMNLFHSLVESLRYDIIVVGEGFHTSLYNVSRTDIVNNLGPDLNRLLSARVEIRRHIEKNEDYKCPYGGAD